MPPHRRSTDRDARSVFSGAVFQRMTENLLDLRFGDLMAVDVRSAAFASM